MPRSVSRFVATCLAVALTAALTACTGVSIRDHVLAGASIESGQPAGPGLRARTAKSPGLSNLAAQVFGDSAVDVAARAAPQPTALDATADTDPLPAPVAQLRATKALLRALIAAENGLDVPDDSLSRSDLREFTETLVRAHVQPHSGLRDPEAERLRAKDAAFSSSSNVLTLQGLTTAYLMAYYKGEFVDRRGGKHAKPKLGMTITNETITGFEDVALCAVLDYIILSSGRIKDPIVFESSTPDNVASRKWLPTGNKPTLAVILEKRLPNTHGVKAGVLEVAISNPETQNGFNKAKLTVLNHLTGMAGDAAQGLSGAILRAFGGLDAGFVIAGKFSFGDNETIAKMADVFVEHLARDATEVATAAALYQLRYKAGTGDESAVGVAAGPDQTRFLSLIKIAENLE